ncbi:MAG: Rrf2 family transcriptional regulator [Myxococcaceae bacterium]|nr:Rrf2 family transcriptional regulator [Myxococcaceae bacterium]
MQHPLQISRKIEYGLRAMIFLASQPPDAIVSFKEIARRMDVPQDFMAKILKTLVAKRMVRSTRGVHGGYSLARDSREISMLDVIEAVEGPVKVNVCQDNHDSCKLSRSCTMYSVWKLGQERMLEVYRHATLDKLAMSDIRPAQPLPVVSA